MQRVRTAAAMLMLSATSIGAQQVAFQYDVPGNTLFTYGYVIQQFTATSANIAGMGVRPSQAAGSNMTFSLFSALPGTLTVPLRSATLNFASATTGLDFVDAFWSPLDVIIGAQYYLMLSSSTGSVHLAYTPDGNGYPGGTLWNGAPQIGWSVYGEDPPFSTDAAFRTWTTTVPEPGTYALFATGLIGIAAVARRQRQRRAASHQC